MMRSLRWPLIRPLAPFVLHVGSFLLIANSVLAGKTINVPANQPTIQAAITAASNGDTVLVAPGTYNEQINFLGKAIVVRSQNGNKVTTIDGAGIAGPVVRFVSAETLSSVLQGFTIQNGTMCCFPYEGGGIEIQNSSPTILSNNIRNNVGAGNGGGINISFGSPVVKGNTITGNSVAFFGGTEGGGIDVGGASSAQIAQKSFCIREH